MVATVEKAWRRVQLDICSPQNGSIILSFRAKLFYLLRVYEFCGGRFPCDYELPKITVPSLIMNGGQDRFCGDPKACFLSVLKNARCFCIPIASSRFFILVFLQVGSPRPGSSRLLREVPEVVLGQSAIVPQGAVTCRRFRTVSEAVFFEAFMPN